MAFRSLGMAACGMLGAFVATALASVACVEWIVDAQRKVLTRALPGPVVEAHVASLRNAAIACSVVIALLLGGLVYVLLRRAFTPLNRLAALARSIEEGRYDVPLQEDGTGEIGAFTRPFAKILESVRAREREIREVQAALRDGEERAQRLLEATPDGILLADGSGRITSVNSHVAAMFGYGTEELRGLPVEVLIPERLRRGHESLRAGYVQQPRRAMGGGRELVGLHRDGREFPVEVGLDSWLRDGDLNFVLCIRDITQRKAAEDALRRSEAHLRTVVDNLGEGVVVSDLEGQILHFNRAAMEMHGFSRPDEYRRLLKQFVETFELSSLEGVALPLEQWPLARILRGEALRDLELRVQRLQGGGSRIFSYGGALVRDPDGKPLIAVVTVRDVTERKETERRIQAQVGHLSLLDQITRAIGERLDLASIFQVVVRTLEESLPLDFVCICLRESAESALSVACLGGKSQALGHERAVAEHAPIDIDENGLGRCIQGNLVYEPDIGQATFPFTRRLALGGQRSLVLAPLRSDSGVLGVLVAGRRRPDAFSSAECEFLRQLSEHVGLAAQQSQLYQALQQAYDDLRQTQQTFMQQERLRALGQMASGIAHDVNNAISPVALYTESLLETEQGLSERARAYLETIQRAVADVAHTVARMREFYRPREPQLSLAPIDVNRVVKQVVDFTRARWCDMPQQRGVVVGARTDLAPDLPRVMGVESEIREALTNLVLNAVDAMPGGGTVTLRTWLAGPASDSGSAAVIEVADDGTGMDEDTRRRCLEPFFTTKGERGTGMGLAMVFGAAQRHNADLEIESAPGAGTTVRLRFPLPAADARESESPGLSQGILPRMRLLLIDDDPILLKALREALEANGHAVTTASAGQTGIDVFRASLDQGEAFAAVITDLGMPHVDGRRVAAAVKGLSPSTPVVLLTGWGQRLVAEGEAPPHVDRVLSKPPKLSELRHALAALRARAD